MSTRASSAALPMPALRKPLGDLAAQRAYGRRLALLGFHRRDHSVSSAQQRRLMVGNQCVDQLVQRRALQNLRKLVQGEPDTMIGDAALRKIIGADAFGTIPAPHQPAPLRRARGIQLLALHVEQAGAQHLHRAGAISVLRALVLNENHDAARKVGDAHGGLGLVHVLAAGAAGTHGVDLKIVVVDLDVDLTGLGKHRDGRCRSVNAARTLGRGYALDAVHAGFELELGVGALAANGSDDLLEPALGALARGQHLDGPALQRGIALVHAEQIAGEQGGLVAAGAGTHFEDRTVLVGGILGQQRHANLFLERGQALEHRRLFLGGEPLHVGLGGGIDQQGFERGKIGPRVAQCMHGLHHRRELGKLARQAHARFAVERRRQLPLQSRVA